MTKFFFLFCLTLLSFSALAQRDPRYCGDRETCTRDNGMFREDTKYARGEGFDCRQALQDAEDIFEREFGRQSACGMSRGPVNAGCFSNRDGSKKVWLECAPASRGNRNRSNTPRCLNIGSRMVC